MLNYLFETSWEVCNKVGGIYAVLSTKARTLQQKFNDNLLFIGPDIWADEDCLFFEHTKESIGFFQEKNSLPAGLHVKIGRWKVPGSPQALLVNYQGLFEHKDAIYAKMWEAFGVDSLHAYGDYDESCMFAVASAIVIEQIVQCNLMTNGIIAHFDEWTTGMGLLYLKLKCSDIATVFTTHATSIGRSICGNEKPLYDYLKGYNGNQMAEELNMQSKHSLERAAAANADEFTTVSAVTAKECEQLLECTPAVTPNAFEPDYVPTGSKFTTKRNKARKMLLRIASHLTGCEISNDATLIATSGRCEFRNKGIDAFVDSCNILRTELKDTEKEVVAFILVPGWTSGPRQDLQASLKNKDITRLPDSVITHNLHYGSNDIIKQKLYFLGFKNEDCDKVKIIYVPSYLNGIYVIFNLPYYDVLIGFDLTIFPSYYEPWGYTPLESTAFSVPTITTKLAGFGQWVIDTIGSDCTKSGVAVVSRNDSNYDETLREIVNHVEDFIGKNKQDIAKIRKAAKTTSQQATWDKFIAYYMDVYEAAVKKRNKRNI